MAVWRWLAQAAAPSNKPASSRAGSLSTAGDWHRVGHIGGPIRSLAVVDGVAYVANSGELAVVDLADPHAPRRVGYVLLPANHVTVSGTYAYVAAKDGLRIVDVATPAARRQVGFVAVPATVLDVAVAGGFAYLAAEEAGLRVVDVSDPNNPAEVGFLDTPGLAHGVALVGGIAYVADYNAGLRAVDISDFMALGEVGVSIAADSQPWPGGSASVQLIDTFDHASAIAGTDDGILVADRMGGLYVMGAKGQEERNAPGLAVSPGLATDE